MSPLPELTPAQKRAIALYKLLMEEVKIRLLSIGQALDGHMVFPAWMIREFCYLQLRMTCELIALSCLVAHGDIKATKTSRFLKQYAADRIFMLLGKIYADFYPAPIRLASLEPHPSGRSIRHFEPIKTGFLTKSDLLSLYYRADHFLHRGKMKNLLSPEPIDEGFPDVVKWVGKIQALLSTHSLKLFDGSRFFCGMTNPENGRVHATMAAPAPPE